jgi:polyhydroxyalkanoate synthesis regulator protein
MDEITSHYEKKVDIMMDKMFGDADSQLKAVTKMTLMNTVLTEEMKETLRVLRDQAFKEAEMINAEMTMTLDASGNVVPIQQELSPRQQDIKVIYHDEDLLRSE